MKTFISAIILGYLLFSSNHLVAQVAFAPIGAEWHYNFETFMSTGYIRISASDDTLISEKSCTILGIFQYEYISPGFFDTTFLGNEYVYEESGVVYYYRYEQFFILYNFNSAIGDSWIFAGDASCEEITGEVVVDSFGYETINGVLLKWIAIHSNSLDWIFNGKVYEKIGGLGSLFPASNCFLEAPILGPLRCYYDSNFGLFKNNNNQSCNYIFTSTESIHQNKEFGTLYPNPATTSVTLKLDVAGNRILNVTLVDTYGRKYFDKIKSLDQKLIIDLSYVRPGFYIVKIEDINIVNPLIVIK